MATVHRPCMGVSLVGYTDDGYRWDPIPGDINSKESWNAFTWKTLAVFRGVS